MKEIKKILTILLLTLVMAGCGEQVASSDDLNKEYEQISVEDLSAEWWKWAMSIPDEINPVRDIVGTHCGVGQKGNIWFLAGGFGSSKIKRNCTIPMNKILFFPIVNNLFYANSDDVEYTCEQAQSSVAIQNDDAFNLYVQINGVELDNPKSFRVNTKKCFNVFENVSDTYDAYPSASDGYWVLLKPLKEGKHIIKFGGQYEGSDNNGDIIQDIEYEILVK